MSGIVKFKPLPFLYVVDQNLLDKFAKVCKKDAPYAYTISQKFQPYVKRYTSRTYQQVELVDGSIVNTRDFKRRPHFYTSHITIENGKWGGRMSFRLGRTDTEGGVVLEQIGIPFKNLVFYVDETKSNLRILIVGGNVCYLETVVTITENVFNDLHEIGTGLAYCIRAMTYGISKGMWDQRYLDLLLKPFSEELMLCSISNRRAALKHYASFLPILPFISQSPFNKELLDSVEQLVNEIGDFPPTPEDYSVKKDLNRLNKMASWVEENDFAGGITGTGFSVSLTESKLAKSHPEMHSALMRHCVYRSQNLWDFKLNSKINLLDCFNKFLFRVSKSSNIHSDWFNVMRAVNMYRRGEIPMFDNLVAGRQLTRLNEISEGIMLLDDIRDLKDLSYNQLRIRYLYLNLIKPVLFKMMKEQKLKTTTGE